MAIPVFQRANLERFVMAALPHTLTGLVPATESRRTLAHAFADLGSRLKEHRRARAAVYRRAAPRFNLFDFIDPDENVLSDILRFLLDPRGTHGQGELFLSLLLKRLCPDRTFDYRWTILAREALTYTLQGAERRRIDLVATLPGFTLALENKQYANEGHRQIEDYCKHLHQVAGEKFCLVFLTRTGTDAQIADETLKAQYKDKGQLVLWSWQTDVPQWLTDCRVRCGSAKIRHFLHDFAGYIDEFLSVAEPLPEHDEQSS